MALMWGPTGFALFSASFVCNPGYGAVGLTEVRMIQAGVGFRGPLQLSGSHACTHTCTHAQLYPEWKLFAQGGECGMA